MATLVLIIRSLRAAPLLLIDLETGEVTMESETTTASISVLNALSVGVAVEHVK
jgi:hypothetical protein